jgi:hypothetical protein
MVREIFAAASLLALAGCAQSGAEPSYAGLADLGAASDADSQSSATADALRHVQSNKILGAMAFQKVTGRAVDPDSLSRNEQ